MTDKLDFLSGGGEMGELIRAHDWSATPLGAPESWPQALRTALRLILNSPYPMYVWWGPELRCFYNDAYRPSIGSERHPVSLGRPGREVWAEIWPVIGPQVEQVLSGAGSVSRENALVPITRGGVFEEVYWTYSYGPIDHDSAPNGVGGVLVICSETTAQVLAARTADEERARLTEVFEQAPTFMAVLQGPEHRFELANPSYDRLIGHRKFIGQTVAEALPDATAQGYVKLLDEVYQTGKPFIANSLKYEMQVRPEDPVAVRYVDFVYHPIKNSRGSITGIFVIGSEVTDRVVANLALADSEKRLRTLSENIPTLCWMADAAGAIFWYNDRWYEYTGTTPEQMAGWGWQVVHDPAVLPEVLQRWKTSLDTGMPFEMVFPLRSATGEFRPFLTRIVPSRDAAGELTGWFGMNADISQQVAAEQSLREADQRKDEFLATLAHELRNPLAPVRSAAQLLRSQQADSKTREWATAVIDRQVQSMARLLDDLLDVSRITRNQLTLQRQVISIASIIQASLEIALPLIEARQHRITVELPEDSIEVDADPLRLSQVFSNLLTNAAKYSNPAGRIEVHVARSGDGVEVFVKDAGVGLASESLLQIFEMFSQVKAAVDRSEGGLGIGLSLVKGIVELHRGKVTAFSEGLGKGSEFRVWLPVATVPVAAEATAMNPVVSDPVVTRSVLVVDDNVDAAQSLGLLLELSGHRVNFAHDGEEALFRAEQLRPDIILLDIGLPKVNGYTVAQAIRAQAWGGTTGLIALTGWGQIEDRRRTQEAGFDHHLTKPVDPDEVLALIASL